MRSLEVDEHIENQVSRQVFRVVRPLGRGGFGAAYLVQPLSRGGRKEGEQICLKLTGDPRIWHGEAYFGELLSGQPNVVRQLDAFPTTIVDTRGSRTVFAITMEFISTGTVREACSDGRLPWPEDRVARKTRALLRPLGLLHNLGTAHRDIKPDNVYVANRAALKLGDFGIAKTKVRRTGVVADMATWDFAPPDLGRYWKAADDVYQVGLLMMTLLTGREITNDIRSTDVTQATVRASRLGAAIRRAIAGRSRRPHTADELAAILP